MAKTRATKPRRAKKPHPPPRPPPVGIMVAVFPLAVWLTVVPFIGASLGFALDVPLRLEIADHLVPGVVMVCAATAALLLRRKPSGATAYLVAAGLVFLSGLWTFSTHVPLVGQAAQGGIDWGTAIFHTAPGVVILVVALIALVPALRTTD